MRDEEIKIGDKLRIRDWEKMAEEFGALYGEILCEARFVEDMKKLCGRPFTVKSKTQKHLPNNKKRFEYTSYENIEMDDEWAWIITSDMLERVTNSGELSDFPKISTQNSAHCSHKGGRI